jgi:hypothetical protein
MDCPGFEKIIDYFDGRLAVTEASQIDDHLTTGCASCSSVRDWYGRVKGIAAKDDSVEPPGWVLKRAFKAFLAHRDSYASGLPGQMPAVLVFDSFYRSELAGIRSTGLADRQLLYSAGGYSIDLQIAQADASSVSLMGQILKEGEEGFDSVVGIPLQLVRGGVAAVSGITDAVGEFRIEGISSGEYDLYFEGRGRRIAVPGIPLSTTP